MSPAIHEQLDFYMDEREVARSLDYQELEEKYQIRKYYPRYIHNVDYSTPEIKELICDKPIYAKANPKQKKPNNKKWLAEVDVITGEPITSNANKKSIKTFERGLRRDLKREQLHENILQKKEHRGFRKERLEEVKTMREHHKNERSDEREESRRLLREHLRQKNRKSSQPSVFLGKEPEGPSQIQTEKALETEEPSGGITLFRHPFGSSQPTLVAANSNQTSIRVATGKVEAAPNPSARKPSISEKLKDLVLSRCRSQKTDNNLKRTKSFDQTKSGMTIKRDSQRNSIRLIESRGRRQSESTRTYLFLKSGDFGYYIFL